jgi:hypothetical protein
MPELARPQKITLGEMRASNVIGLMIYLSDYHCSRWMAISGDRWPADIRLSDFPAKLAAGAVRMSGRPNFHWEPDTRQVMVQEGTTGKVDQLA